MRLVGCLLTTVLALMALAPGDLPAGQPGEASGMLIVQGKVTDTAGHPVADANVLVLRNGKPLLMQKEVGAHDGFVSGTNGLFMVEIPAPRESIEGAKWTVKITRSSFKPSQTISLAPVAEAGGGAETGATRFVASAMVTLERLQGTAFWVALAVFIAVYVLIAFEILHRTLAAFVGAGLLLVITHTLGNYYEGFKILTYEQALHTVDWNVVFLLMGMMIIVGVLKNSGVFQWLAYKSFQVARGKIFVLSCALCLVTAVASAFLDNVTTMLLLTPVTMEIALVLRVSPWVFLMPEVVASNFGGTATLIGDPPNIMIGSYAGLTFNDFVYHLTPVVLVILILQLFYNKALYGKAYKSARVDDVPHMISFLREQYPITDRRILWVGGTVLIGVVALFILHGFFHMEVSVAALFGASLIVLLNKMDIVHILEKEIEWPSLIFFIMLFIVVGAAEQTGILQAVADWILGICQGNLTIAVLIILWVAGVASAIVDNIPFTATMLPITAFLGKTIPGAESGVLWWALALGACFGGNGTIIGASANVVTTGIAERAGHKITFFDYVKQAAPITVISLILSSVYLLVVF